MVRTFLLFSLFLVYSVSAAAPATQSTRPEVLTVSGIVTCPADKIWRCFTTGEGIVQAWGVKIAKVDFRVGGMIRTSYNPKVNLDSDEAIGNQILAYEPGRLLIIKPIAPEGASEDIKEICKVGWNAIYLDPVAPDRTKVTVAGMGYAHTPLLDQAYEKFKVGNAYTIKHMQKALGDPDSDVKVRKAFDLLKSLEGEWICEGAKDDPVFRACSVWKADMKGCLLRARNWLGDAAAMRNESEVEYFIDPTTGGLAFTSFFPMTGIARGHVRLLDDSRVAMDWTMSSGSGEPRQNYIEIAVTDSKTHVISLWNNATGPTSSEPSLKLQYYRVEQAPPDMKRVK